MKPFSLAQAAVPRAKARLLAVGAVLIVVALELGSTLLCQSASIESMALSVAFLLIPLSPALVALFTPNPLCSVAASAAVGGWVIYAFYFECVRPYQGGGASMVYLGVWFYGFLCAAGAAVVAIPALRLLGIRVSAS